MSITANNIPEIESKAEKAQELVETGKAMLAEGRASVVSETFAQASSILADLAQMVTSAGGMIMGKKAQEGDVRDRLYMAMMDVVMDEIGKAIELSDANKDRSADLIIEHLQDALMDCGEIGENIIVEIDIMPGGDEEY